MSRDLLPLSGYSTNPTNEVTSNIVGLVEFLEIDLPTGNLYLTNAGQAYSFGGNTYTPVTSTGAPMGGVDNYNESTDAIPRPMTLQLSGVDPTMIANLVNQNVQWVPITWSLGLIDSHNNLLNGTPFLVTQNYLGDCTITLGMNSGTVIINADNLLADMQDRNSGQFQTVQDQQQRGAAGNTTFSKDTFFSFAQSLTFTYTYWGQLGPSQIGINSGAPVPGQNGVPFPIAPAGGGAGLG